MNKKGLGFWHVLGLGYAAVKIIQWFSYDGIKNAPENYDPITKTFNLGGKPVALTQYEDAMLQNLMKLKLEEAFRYEAIHDGTKNEYLIPGNLVFAKTYYDAAFTALKRLDKKIPVRRYIVPVSIKPSTFQFNILQFRADFPEIPNPPNLKELEEFAKIVHQQRQGELTPPPA